MNFNPADIRVMVRVATQKTGAPVHDEDLEQEASLRVVEALQRESEVRHPRAFLMKIVHDTVSDHWRRRRPVEDIATVDEARFAQPCDAEHDIDRKRLREALRKGIARLDASKRTTIKLFYSEERSINEIARLQQKSPSAVKMELHRARRALARIVFRVLHKKSR